MSYDTYVLIEHSAELPLTVIDAVLSFSVLHVAVELFASIWSISRKNWLLQVHHDVILPVPLNERVLLLSIASLELLTTVNPEQKFN